MALQAAKIPCGRCKAPVDVMLAPRPLIMNGEFSSVLVIEHSGQKLCTECGAVVNPGMAGMANLAMVALVVPSNQQNLIVAPVGVKV